MMKLLNDETKSWQMGYYSFISIFQFYYYSTKEQEIFISFVHYFKLYIIMISYLFSKEITSNKKQVRPKN